MKAKNFAIIGVGGYIAPRHLKAIKETGNNLVAAMDINDSVGILDSYFPEAKFFTRFEDFDRFLEDFKYTGNKLDFISICTPNHLHGSHIRYGLKNDINVICEKPVLINPMEFEEIEKIEKERSKGAVNAILQVRELPSIKKLKKKIENDSKQGKYEIDLTYITSRGPWYLESWKGDERKSGGLGVNIGIHFFDMLIWIFGDYKKIEVHHRSDKIWSGYMELEKANVRWYLSINNDDLKKVGEFEKSAFRSIKYDGKEIEFSNVFSDLHTVVYKKILKGEGPRLKDAKQSVILLHEIRQKNIVDPEEGRYHHLFSQIEK